jgi:DNA-binding NarL/FixJ family response regulator
MDSCPNPPQKRVTVLLVDDMPQVLHDLQQLLELSGVIDIVGEARDGEQAVRLAAQLEPAVVLMDLEMPGIGGCEATRRIKAQTAAARVVILTVHDGPAEEACARSAGADAFVTKGASYEALLKAILQAGSTSNPASTRKEGKHE